MVKSEIEQILTETFAPVSLEVIDDSAKHAGHAGARESGGGHYIVNIVSKDFEGKTMVQCHRMIYDALGDHMGTTIHALAITAKAKNESS